MFLILKVITLESFLNVFPLVLFQKYYINKCYGCPNSFLKVFLVIYVHLYETFSSIVSVYFLLFK